jgi:regulator of protease activity HflC (stomatin/prohibitin superfamily)
MAEIRNLAIVRHLRSEPTSHILKYSRGTLKKSGRGLAFWFMPLSASIAQIPVDDRELPFLFHGRSVDFQDVTAQGVITFRVVDPLRVSERVDFTLDLSSGAYTRQPMEKLSLLLTQLAQQHALAYVTQTPVRRLLTDGYAEIRSRIAEGLAVDEGLQSMGLAIVTVRLAAVQPTADLEKALEMPTREKIQQEADQATFERRALAVEKERAIEENELKNRIELARREEELIRQTGQNERRRTEEQVAAKKLEVTAAAERTHIEADAQAGSIRAVEGARLEAERGRMDVYRDLPASVMMGLAAQELAGKLTRIDHLNVSPEMFGPMLADLMKAGTERLEAKRTSK